VTDRPHHMLTETDDIRSALAVAASRWPGEQPAELLLRLIRAGREELMRMERPE